MKKETIISSNMNTNNFVFNAEIKRTSQRKAASLDNVYETTLATNNPSLMELGKLPSDTLIKVTIEVLNGKEYHQEEEQQDEFDPS